MTCQPDITWEPHWSPFEHTRVWAVRCVEHGIWRTGLVCSEEYAQKEYRAHVRWEKERAARRQQMLDLEHGPVVPSPLVHEVAS
jgi:hypothetical protein